MTHLTNNDRRNAMRYYYTYYTCSQCFNLGTRSDPSRATICDPMANGKGRAVDANKQACSSFLPSDSTIEAEKAGPWYKVHALEIPEGYKVVAKKETVDGETTEASYIVHVAHNAYTEKGYRVNEAVLYLLEKLGCETPEKIPYTFVEMGGKM